MPEVSPVPHQTPVTDQRGIPSKVWADWFESIRKVIRDLSTDLGSGLSGTLPIVNGGTNSNTALSNNRVMQSSSDMIVEAAAITAARALISDANGIPTHSGVSSTELGHLIGVTSAIQTQISAKLGTTLTSANVYVGNGSNVATAVSVSGAISLSNAGVTSYNGTVPINKGGTNSTTALSNNRVIQSSGGAIVEASAIVADRALVSDSNGIPVHSSVSGAELGYLSGVSGAIQTQINGKQTSTLANGKILIGDGSNLAAAQSVTGDISITNSGVTAYAGTVPLNKGGTGQTTKAAAFDALSPMSASGDIVYGGASGTGTRLAKGSNGDVLTLAAGLPVWTAPSAAAITVLTATSSTKTPTASGNYSQMTGATVTLTAGTWLLMGSLDVEPSGGAPTISSIYGWWLAANGADSGSKPASLSLDAGTDFTYFGSSADAYNISMPTVKITVASNTPVYIVPRVGTSNASQTRIVAYIIAQKVG